MIKYQNMQVSWALKRYTRLALCLFFILSLLS